MEEEVSLVIHLTDELLKEKYYSLKWRRFNDHTKNFQFMKERRMSREVLDK